MQGVEYKLSETKPWKLVVAVRSKPTTCDFALLIGPRNCLSHRLGAANRVDDSTLLPTEDGARREVTLQTVDRRKFAVMVSEGATITEARICPPPPPFCV